MQDVWVVDVGGRTFSTLDHQERNDMWGGWGGGGGSRYGRIMPAQVHLLGPFYLLIRWAGRKYGKSRRERKSKTNFFLCIFFRPRHPVGLGFIFPGFRWKNIRSGVVNLSSCPPNVPIGMVLRPLDVTKGYGKIQSVSLYYTLHSLKITCSSLWGRALFRVSLDSFIMHERQIYILPMDIWMHCFIVYYSQIARKLDNFEIFYLNLQNISLSAYNQTGCIDILYLTSQLFINFRIPNVIFWILER